MHERYPDFGGLWVSDPDQLLTLMKPGAEVYPTLLIFFGGGYMMRVNFDIDYEKKETTAIRYAGSVYLVDGDTVSFMSTDESHKKINDVQWRYRNGGLEFNEGDGWWRYLPINEEAAVNALQVPSKFFEGMRMLAKQGHYTYYEHTVVPGHLPKKTRV